MPALALDGEHEETPVGPVLVVEQVVEVQPLPEVAALGVHDALAVGPVVLVEQVVVV